MRQRVRAYARAELDIVTVLPRLLLRSPGGMYHRGTFGAALALAFTPVVLTEGLVLHLLLRGGWIAWIVTAAHVYVLIWLWGFALGPLRRGASTWCSSSPSRSASSGRSRTCW